MSTKLKYLYFKGKNILIYLIVLGFIISAWALFGVKAQKIEANLNKSSIEETPENKLAIIEGNSLLPTFNHSEPKPQVIKRLKVIITGYSSSTFETDGDPYITASGTRVREGIVANNLLPIGTKIKIPELYGDKIFVVEDRMHWKKGPYHIDIWFPSYWQAKSFGAKTSYIEILEG